MLKVIWLEGNEDLKDSYKIRKEVFVLEQNVPIEIELDSKDEMCKHIVIYDEDEPIATGRIVLENNICFLGRICIVKKFRGRGIGVFLVENMIKMAAEMGVEDIYIHAQKYAEDFYKRLNFKRFGEVFDEGGIEHINMVLTIWTICKYDVNITTNVYKNSRPMI